MTDQCSPGSEKLLPCPFCGGAVQFRKALHISDGNVDSVIHAAPTDCPMVVFEDGSTDESILARWNVRAAAQSASEPVWWRWRFFSPRYGWSKWIALNCDEVEAFRRLQADQLDAGKVELQPLCAMTSTQRPEGDK